MCSPFHVKRAATLAVILVVLVLLACSDEVARETEEASGFENANYRIRCLEFGDELELRFLHPCVDAECREVDVRATIQIVAWPEGEIRFNARRYLIDHLTLVEGIIVAFIRNNHSAFIVKICRDGSLDYLAEVAELYDRRVVEINGILDPPFLSISITTNDNDPTTSLSDNAFEFQILMASGLENCE